MEKDILAELTIVFKEVFDDDSIQITRATTAADVADWDSLTHIELIVAVEQYFNIQFKSLDLKKLDSVGDLADLVMMKLKD